MICYVKGGCCVLYNFMVLFMIYVSGIFQICVVYSLFSYIWEIWKLFIFYFRLFIFLRIRGVNNKVFYFIQNNIIKYQFDLQLSLIWF